MRFPTSTIVMAVLTCIPFGLAIRETLNGKPAVDREDDKYGFGDSESDEDHDAEYASRRAAEIAEEEANERLEAARKLRLVTARRDVYGAEVATLGAGFRGIFLGMPEAEIRSHMILSLEDSADVDIDLLAADQLDSITIQPERGASDDESEELCSSMHDALKQAWGPGFYDYQRRYWLNATTGTRAAISTGDECQLVFDRYVPPTTWITKTKTSIVPAWLVGQSVAKLRTHLHGRAEFADGEPVVSWLGTGLGVGTGPTRYEAHVVKGKVVALIARADVFNIVAQELASHLTQLHGEPTEDYRTWTWKSRPPILLETDEGDEGVRLTIGTPPSDE